MSTAMKYENFEQLNQDDLEFAWLACIFEAPDQVCEHGLGGLDRSFFKNKHYFDLGADLLKQMPYDRNWPSDELLKRCSRLKLIGRTNFSIEFGGHLPSQYRFYCEEIERRGD